MIRKIFLIAFLLIISCDIDEDAPDYPTGFRGLFKLKNGKPRIQINWYESASDDVAEYHIFRSTDLGQSFDSLSKVGGSDLSFSDTTISWQESFGYKIRAKDQSTNIGEFSDSIFIECYKPSGNWAFPKYDSTTVCSVYKSSTEVGDLGIEGAEERRDLIRKSFIDNGFKVNFDYPFVWESWRNSKW